MLVCQSFMPESFIKNYNDHNVTIINMNKRLMSLSL